MLTEQKAQEVIGHIVNKLNTYFEENSLSYAIFGKSEGLDSSVIAGLLSKTNIHPIGVIMPIFSDPKVEKIGREVLDYFHIDTIKIDLSDEFTSLSQKYQQNGSIEDQLAKITTISTNEHDIKVSHGNIKARLRMITLYHIAKITNGIVVSTDNYSEYWMGFWTLCGDVGDIAPIQQIFKGEELYTIARVLGVPQSSIDAPPSDGLGITTNSYDEEQLQMSYEKLDPLLRSLLKTPNKTAGELAKKHQLSIAQVKNIQNRLKSSNYKRTWPITFTREEIGLPPVEIHL